MPVAVDIELAVAGYKDCKRAEKGPRPMLS